MIQAQAGHAAINAFDCCNGELQIGPYSISRLAQRLGQTPFYAYDRAAITQRVQQLRQQLPSALALHYAIKANPLPAVVQWLATLVDGFDVASIDEMQLALDTPLPAQQISLAGPAKTAAALRQAIAAGVTLHIESLQELETLAQQSQALGIAARVAIRINPRFELKRSGMKMGGGAKPFGIDEEQVPAVLLRLAVLDVLFEGFHIYSGSQILNAEVLIEAQRQSLALAVALAPHCPVPPRRINIGGGLGIPYFAGEQALNLAPIADALAEALAHTAQTLPDAKVVMELGRYLVGEAGVFVTRVVDIKISRGQTFLVTDGGLNHHLAASGNFGQVIRKNYPVAIATKLNTTPSDTVTIVGPLCTPLDVLADAVLLPTADVGDLVAVFQSGAYGYSASPHGFLSQTPALQALV